MILKAEIIYFSNELKTILNPCHFADKRDIPSERSLPIITSRKLEYPVPYVETKQAWLESLSTLEDQKLGMIDLHPHVFGMYPR